MQENTDMQENTVNNTSTSSFPPQKQWNYKKLWVVNLSLAVERPGKYPG